MNTHSAHAMNIALGRDAIENTINSSLRSRQLTDDFVRADATIADRSSLATSGGYYNRNGELVNNNIMTNVTGTVNMTNYVQWLTDHGYKLGNITGAGLK